MYTFLLATAVIMSITGAAPFQGIEDQNLAVAYISAFILVFLVRTQISTSRFVADVSSLIAQGNSVSFRRTQTGCLGFLRARY